MLGRTLLRTICVFCGSNPGARPAYRQAAAELGTLLAKNGLGLVYGGGRVGLMGTVADACLAAGGSVTGVIPQALADKELAHRGLTALHVVRTMHERKSLMAELSDAFIALPGGIGTFEELLEVTTWTQLGLHRKACGVVNVEGYYDGLLLQADRAVADGFLTPTHRQLLLTHADPAEVLGQVRQFVPPQLSKWVEREDL